MCALTYGSMFERSHADGILVSATCRGRRGARDLTAQHRFVIGVSIGSARAAFPGVYSDSVLGTISRSTISGASATGGSPAFRPRHAMTSASAPSSTSGS